ncbi:proton-conducting transporter membrane subunit [Larkinella bovis]|uniref:Proton-conducting transporter membrane subunit n=1 Tax=Larkinella bovis TaxID=683041 RepID=A0ABW0IGG3_9BACT
MESAVLLCTAVGTPGLFFFRGETKYFFSLFLHIVLIVTASSWALRALSSGGLMQFNLLELVGLPLPGNIDSLGAFFLLIISLTFLAGLLYAHGYLKLYRQTRSERQFSQHHLALLWLHISMLLVVTLRGGAAFLAVWELMHVSAFSLVMFEGERKEILKTGVTYLVQMQIGFALLATAFLILRASGFSFGFDGLSGYFATHDLLPVFLLLLSGFGLSIGFVPLHSWLPSTHLATPSHVSGIMSGVLIQMGFYGILRVLTFVQTDFFTISLIILALSLLSGIVGIRSAFVQTDGKTVLAYSSIANTGIIGIGIGTGLLGLAFHHPTLAALGFTGGILHIANHALAKSVLFYSLGSVYRATNTRTLEQLGGLIKTMPKTTVSFLLGSMALCGFPPFNGFVSEFLIYTGLIQNLGLTGGSLNLLLWTILSGLGFISLYSVFGFTKIFKTAFLGRPRSTAAAQAKEVSDGMLVPKALLVLCILAIGLFPALFIKLASQVTALYVLDLNSLGDLAPPFGYTALTGVFLAGMVFFAFRRGRPPKPADLDYPNNRIIHKLKREHRLG